MTTIFNKGTRRSAPLDCLTLTGVDFGYPGNDIFRGLTLAITTGAVTAVVGSNGSGKSTLLSLLAGVLRPDDGEIHLDTHDIALAVQRSQVTDTFPITVAEAVMMGRWRRLGLWRRPTRSDREVVEHWLFEMGLDTLRNRILGELSGGQRQRALLAQAFTQQAPLLLLDEPTTGLDDQVVASVIGHLRQLAATGTTVLAATHDTRVVRAADRCIDLDDIASR